MTSKPVDEFGSIAAVVFIVILFFLWLLDEAFNGHRHRQRRPWPAQDEYHDNRRQELKARSKKLGYIEPHPSLDLRNGMKRYEDIIKSDGRLPTIDLHCMTTNEALEWTGYFLRIKKGTGRARVITGRGLHSEHGPILKPAIKEYLDRRRIRYHETDGGGSFLVYQ